MQTTLQRIQNKLNQTYGWRKFRFGLPLAKLSLHDTYDTLPEDLRDNWVWRYLIACVIVGGSNEFKMLRICDILFKQYPTPEALASADVSELYRLFGKFTLEQGGMKAQRIIVISDAVVQNDNKVWRSKQELMALRGVGEHTAEVIMATCYGESHFAIDIHVKVISKRWGIPYTKLRKMPYVDGQFSRNFVDFGQNFCGRQPKCEACILRAECRQIRQENDVSVTS